MGSASRSNSTRARKVQSGKPAALPQPSPDRSSILHLNDILDRFGRALAIVTVSRIAIEASEKLAQEECALRQGIAALNTVYNDLDLAIGTVGRRGVARGAS